MAEQSSRENLPQLETYNENELTVEEFVHPSDSVKYPDAKLEDFEVKNEVPGLYELFHDGVIDTSETSEEHEEKVKQLQNDGYFVITRAANGSKRLYRTLMSKDRNQRLIEK